MIDKNAHVNVIYSLEQVNYISFGVGIVYYLSCGCLAITYNNVYNKL